MSVTLAPVASRIAPMSDPGEVNNVGEHDSVRLADASAATATPERNACSCKSHAAG